VAESTSSTLYHREVWSGLASEDADADVGVLGVPFDNAASFRKGTAQAPAIIRAITLHVAPATEDGKQLSGLRVRDYGDVPTDLNWERYFGSVEAMAEEALRHPFALFLGGDHSVTIPLFNAFSKSVSGRLGYIQFDSHPDLIDEFEGHRWSHGCTARRVLEIPSIEPRDVAFVGIRSWLREELEFVEAHQGIRVHSARDVHQRGIEVVARDVVSQLEDVDAVYFSLDIDGLDPAYAPGTGTPEAGGPSTRELLDLLSIVFAGLPVRALDVVEVCPPIDHADITSVAAIKIIYEVFGWVGARN